MDAFPTLITDRLILGKLLVADIPNIIEYAGNKKVAATTLNIPHPYAEKDAVFWMNMANKGFEEKTQYTFGIRLKSNNEFIGGIGLNVKNQYSRGSLGYWIGEPFWDNGYTTEATAAVIQFGFEQLNLHKIFAMHLLENPASGKVMIKNGMIKEGELKDHTKKGDVYRSVAIYRLIKDEYKNENHVK